ncbi:MAG: 3-phosphoshikimate 1-carboxyvinyltransferase, partial [Oscillospiraceae bacterium]|nr:3-phosphoshikimate 1-carboxyvinyltransferase [Oscillospiraceae bacterium]
MNGHKTIARFPSGVITAPPSKSLSHRAVICAALADGRSVVENIGVSRDIEATVGCMAALGAGFSRVNGRLTAEGTACPAAGGTLDCGESGSTLRFLLPLAALSGRPARLTGQGRLMERPMGPYLDALGARGAALVPEDGGLTVRGPLTAGTYALPGDVSSQFVSGLLFALPLLEGDSEIVL